MKSKQTCFMIFCSVIRYFHDDVFCEGYLSIHCVYDKIFQALNCSDSLISHRNSRRAGWHVDAECHFYLFLQHHFHQKTAFSTCARSNQAVLVSWLLCRITDNCPAPAPIKETISSHLFWRIAILF